MSYRDLPEPQSLYRDVANAQRERAERAESSLTECRAAREQGKKEKDKSDLGGHESHGGRDDPEHIARESATARREREIMSEWQPISTAPKDGTEVLVNWPHSVLPPVEISYFHTQIKHWQTRRLGRHTTPQPTHWMPMPDPPAPTDRMARASREKKEHERKERSVALRPTSAPRQRI